MIASQKMKLYPRCRKYFGWALLPSQLLTAEHSTLVFAATDTTSVALVQILQSLSERPEAQEELRREIQLATEGGGISHDELLALPFMDAVCRETLRL